MRVPDACGCSKWFQGETLYILEYEYRNKQTAQHLLSTDRILEIGLEGLEERFGGQAHHVEIRAAELGAGDKANPFLNAIRSRLVERMETADIIVNLCLCERSEADVRSGCKRAAVSALGRSHRERHTRKHLVRLSAQEAQHPPRIGFIVRLAQHLPIEPNDGVRRDE